MRTVFIRKNGKDYRLGFKMMVAASALGLTFASGCSQVQTTDKSDEEDELDTNNTYVCSGGHYVPLNIYRGNLRGQKIYKQVSPGAYTEFNGNIVNPGGSQFGTSSGGGFAFGGSSSRGGGGSSIGGGHGGSGG